MGVLKDPSFYAFFFTLFLPHSSLPFFFFWLAFWSFWSESNKHLSFFSFNSCIRWNIFGLSCYLIWEFIHTYISFFFMGLETPLPDIPTILHSQEKKTFLSPGTGVRRSRIDLVFFYTYDRP
ncbi:hypothetical protein GGR53DRAFT_228748 [Hypoxylon sp. FL1150]|nr:hypothetical protein GGR53DRAFT_228748 [Hypoxylon sp. FL1150]